LTVGRRSTGLLTCLLVTLVFPLQAGAQDVFTDNNFEIDAVCGPVLGSSRIVGMGGAYTALAEDRPYRPGMDNGKMRLRESRQVMDAFQEHDVSRHLHFRDATDDFLATLGDEVDPEKKRLADLKGGLALLNLKGSPKAVLESAKLLDIFDTYDSETEALEALGG